jgi:type IV pilus assembly protein PilC
VKSLTSIIEPIMMILIGGMVGVIVVAMYLPIFSMFNLVK